MLTECFVQIDDLYGASMDGPELEDMEEVQIPEVQLPHDLSPEELARLPDRDIPMSEALDVYNSTVQELEHIFSWKYNKNGSNC